MWIWLAIDLNSHLPSWFAWLPSNCILALLAKFCSPAESRYHPIEGEALAAVYGLQKCKFFILGLANLTLTLDHKPLLAIFGNDQHLEEIENPRGVCRVRSLW